MVAALHAMPLLQLADVAKSYRLPDGSERRVVDIASFAMEPGEQVALAGGSGSGKTTLLNLIAGILRADSGSIECDGIDVAQLGEAERDRFRAERIGYVFQTFNLLQGYTALENVELGMMFGVGVDGEYARALLERVGLGDRLHDRPRTLSVGQQQRVAVARALANKPRLVLADEPTGNLDPAAGAEALRLIREICSEHNAALLLVSHDEKVLGQFDTVHRLSDLNAAAAREVVA